MKPRVYIETTIVSYFDMESSASRQCRTSWQDRRGVSGGGVGAADHLHARGTNGAEAMTRRRDPIVEEVRKHRAAIAREHGNRLDSILAAFRREEASWPAGTVSRPPKQIIRSRKMWLSVGLTRWRARHSGTIEQGAPPLCDPSREFAVLALLTMLRSRGGSKAGRA